MPEAISSIGAGLGHVGAGLLDTYFGGVAKERDKADEDKKYETQLRLQALHTLLASGNTQVADIPNIMALWAKEAKIHKDPGIQEAISHMKQAATQSVPYGPERETTDSQVSRVTSQFAAPQATTSPMATSINLRTVPSEPGAPTSASYSPYSAATENLSAPAPVSTPALKVVPPEPQMYQPTRVAGSLTQDELEASRKSQFDLQHQGAMLDRQAKLAEAAGDRQSVRDIQRQKDQLDQIRARADESRKTQDRVYENKIKMLEPAMQAHAGLRKAQIAVAITAQNPGMDPAEVDKRAGDMALAEIQVGVAQKQAQIEKSKAEIKHWANIDARALVSKGGAATEGMSAGQARIFRVNTLEIVPELHSVQSQLEKLKTDQALLGGQDPAIQQRITELTGQQDQLLFRLKTERDKVLAPTQSAPSAPGTRQPSRPAASDPLGLFQK